MPNIPIIYLLDPSGQAWQVAITDGAEPSTISASGITTGFNSILLNDVETDQTWRLSVTDGGEYTWISTQSTCAQSQVLCYAPNGNLYALQIASGELQTAIGTLCDFSLADMDSALAARLYDPTGQFWTQSERILYIQEAFRTWNALTSYWRGDFTFQSRAGIAFYDITDPAIAPKTLRPLTVTNAQMATLIEYHLLEPPAGLAAWTGSAQFTLSDIESALARRRDECLGVTGCTITHRVVPAIPGRTPLFATVLELRRVAFTPLDPTAGLTSPMFQDDAWGLTSYEYESTVTSAGIPSVWLQSTQPILSFDVDIPPIPGSYDLLTIESGTAISLATSPCSITVPDDWAWVVKWGALADLLNRESNAKDLLRAKYAEGRYRQGLTLLASASALVNARVDNLPLECDAVKSADQYNVGWQGQGAGAPQVLLTAGLNLIALSPLPDASTYSVTATVVQNAPIPASLGDCLNVTQDVFDVLIDYSQHLAAFKMGGQEFLATEPLLQRFMHLAALYSSKLSEQGEFTKLLYAISQRESNMSPRYTPGTDPGESGDQ